MIPLQQFHSVCFGGSGAAPAFVSAGSGAAEIPLSGTLQVPYPSSPSAGQFMVCHVYSADASASAISVPAGWTDIKNQDATGDTTHTARAFYKVATGSESGNLDVTISAADNFAAGRIYLFSRGAGVEAAASANTDSSSATINAVNITTLGASRLAVQLIAADTVGATIGNLTGESGADYTEATAEYVSAGGTLLSCQIATVGAATAISGGSVAMSDVGTYRNRIAFAIY